MVYINQNKQWNHGVCQPKVTLKSCFVSTKRNNEIMVYIIKKKQWNYGVYQPKGYYGYNNNKFLNKYEHMTQYNLTDQKLYINIISNISEPILIQDKIAWKSWFISTKRLHNFIFWIS